MPLQSLPAGSGTCLDGSPAGYYIWKSSQDDRALKYRTQWLIFLEGGGWCLSPEDCGLRATTSAGSSRRWAKFGSKGGILGRCCTVSGMDFCNINKVFVPYCDGASFGGAREIALDRAGNVSLGGASRTPPSVRSDGRAILSGVLAELVTHHGLASATDVLFSGCSAGGLAALLYAPAVRAAIRDAGAPLKRFKVAAFSGLFFPPTHMQAHIHAGGSHHELHRRMAMADRGAVVAELTPPRRAVSPLSPFERQMRRVVEMSNLSVPPACQSASAHGQAWRCLMGTAPLEALPADIPVFVMQSTFDLFHTNCIVGVAAEDRSRYFQAGCLTGGWGRCLHWMTPMHGSMRQCSARQLSHLGAFQQHVAAALSTSAALQRPGSGAFLHSCNDHCADGNAWQGILVDGVSMVKAFSAWWKGRADAPPMTRLGCMLNFTHPVDRGPPDCRRPKAACSGAPKYKDARKSIALAASRIERAMGRVGFDACGSVANGGGVADGGGGACVDEGAVAEAEVGGSLMDAAGTRA